MFKSRTVFVVGAGASAEADLPIGNKLTQQIGGLVDLRINDLQQRTSGDPQVWEIVRRISHEKPQEFPFARLVESAQHLADAMEMAISIDTFLESFAGNRALELVGKLGIAKAISNAERQSRLAPRHNLPFSMTRVAETWYVYLAQLLFMAVPANAPERAFENVTFIVFNYDRCLQVFLFSALQRYFKIPGTRAGDIINSARFLHPYGNLGSIFPGASDYAQFAAERCDIRMMAERISTFSESVADGELLSTIRREIRNAETVVFLGFAFHDQNMAVLSAEQPRADKPPTRRVFGTAFEMSESDRDIAEGAIRQLYTGEQSVLPKIAMLNAKCGKFFTEYWRSLTAA